MRIAINGFGRIGKNFLRTILTNETARKQIDVAVINVGKGDPQAAALALKYDTLMGTFPGTVTISGDTLVVDNLKIRVIQQLDPLLCPWKEEKIDWVVDATGHFTHAEDAKKHLVAGAKAVLITAPAHGEDVSIIPGVNYEQYIPEKHKIVSLGSCTSNALYTTLKVLVDAYTIEHAYMTTVHAYTNNQALLDVDATSKDLRKKRAAAVNIVPTSTGAMEVVGRIMPELAGRISGCSLRVPVTKVSIIDLTALLKEPVSAEHINETFQKASQGRFKNIIEYTQMPLVSSDYAGNSHSVIIDSLMTTTQGPLAKVFGWYDNEWGYSCRLRDFLLFTAK